MDFLIKLSSLNEFGGMGWMPTGTFLTDQDILLMEAGESSAHETSLGVMLGADLGRYDVHGWE